jgi:hypothetical protein
MMMGRPSKEAIGVQDGMGKVMLKVREILFEGYREKQ